MTADDPIRAYLDEAFPIRNALSGAVMAVLDLARELGTDYAHADFTGEYVEAEIRRAIATALRVDT